MKTIIKQSLQGIWICLVVFIGLSFGNMIKYIRMSNNGCIPEDLYTFFQLHEIWHIIPIGAILYPLMVWLLLKLPADKKPMPVWLVIIFRWIAIIFFTALMLFCLWAVFIKNPC